MRTTAAILSLALLLPGAAPAIAFAATLTIVNDDGLGEGFNDSTPAIPVGGNTGVTVGQQRLIAAQFAADLLGAELVSSVPIEVEGQFNALSCNATSGVLGQAGPETVHANFTGAVLPDTWYVAAQANALSGIDLNGATAELSMTFNSNLGASGCLEGTGWYYGLDANPGGLIDFVTVLTHELSHGLGFLSLVSLSSGQKFLGLDDAYMVHLEDHSTGKLFPTMNNAQRKAAQTDGTQFSSDLHWTGQEAVDAAAVLSSGTGALGHVEIYAPNPAEPGSSVSHWARTLTPSELMEPSYTGPNHAIDITVALFRDLGWPSCGDDVVDPGEECDGSEAGACQSGVCSSQCTCLSLSCGDNVVNDPEEECDGTDDAACASGCDANCRCTPVCGDSQIQYTETCDDGNAVGGDCCNAICKLDAAGAPCSDGDLCNGLDACDGAGSCLPGTATPCFEALKSKSLVRQRTPDLKDALSWKWRKGDEVTLDDLGDPLTTTDYALCIFDTSVDVPALATSLAVPAGAGWDAIGDRGFLYKDKSGVADGVMKLQVRTGAAGKSKAQLKAKGDGMPLPMPFAPGQLFEQDSRVVFELRNTSGACWASEYSAAGTAKNDGDDFKAKSP